MKKILTGIFLFTLVLGCCLYNTKKIFADSVEFQQGNILSNKAEVQTPNLAEQYKMTDAFILIKKSEFKLYAIDGQGNILAGYGCALGKNPGQKEKEGDMKTPDGVFPIDEIIDASWWMHDFHDGKGVIKGAYGPWFISLDTMKLSGGRWSGIGIHGTHAPESIGTMASEGCIRLNNENISRLKQFVKVGMKVVIEE